MVIIHLGDIVNSGHNLGWFTYDNGNIKFFTNRHQVV